MRPIILVFCCAEFIFSGLAGAQVPSPQIFRGAGQFSGSVPSAEPLTDTLSLTLQDAIQRGLKQNLGIVSGDQATRIARAQQMQVQSALKPSANLTIADTDQQIDLAAFGFNFKLPGVNIPSVVGPFNVFDARAHATVPLLDFPARANARTSANLTRAADFTQLDARDTVAQLVAAAYLQVIADEARVEESRIEVKTAQTLYQKAQDLLKAGLSPALDTLRAQVELQSQQTRLRSFENDFAKDKLSLARAIGIPLRQPFVLADKVPYAELAPPDLDAAVEQALKTRSDYRAADARVQAAESAKRAATVQRYPSLALNGDYGDIGSSLWNSHGTFTASIGMRMSLWDGGRIRGEIEQADALLQQRKAEAADLRGRIEYDVRSALLDLQTATDQVQLARSSVQVARQALTQAQDRFTAGVADNIEVVQAQNAEAGATTSYIDSLFAHNLAKVAFARALGVAGQGYTGLQPYLGGK